MSEESHMGWKLVQGVRRDIINFFKLYGNTDSIRFEDFCKVWKEMNFSLIFSNRIAFIELLEFSEELLQIVKEYLFPVYELYIRIAALYMLYGLYFKQPIKGAAKIRFTKSEWEEVYNLVECSKAEKHYDVAFIFIKLYLNGAYTFPATVRPAGLERGFRKYFEKRSSLFSKVDVELLYRPLINEKLVNSLVKLESLYCRKKSELLGNKNLVFIDGGFAESLQQDLFKYECLSQNEQNMKIKVPINSETANNPVNEGQSSSSKVGVQTRSRCKRRKNQESGDNKKSDKEVSNKWNKFSKNFLDLVAKKKAEYYIQKLQTENNQSELIDKKPLLLGLCELDGTEVKPTNILSEHKLDDDDNY